MISSPGRAFCEECTASVDFMPFQGFDSCLHCPDHAVASNSHSDCECSAGYYAINMSTYSLTFFMEVDYDSYLNYKLNYIDEEAEYNPNELVGFW